jgi:hypothetical protein
MEGFPTAIHIQSLSMLITVLAEIAMTVLFCVGIVWFSRRNR